MDWPTIAPAILAAFLASLVEFVEAFTIVLAVGTVQGWRPALTGAVAGAVVLAIAIAILGPALELIPLRALQVVIGVLLLLFGLRWLHKAILRSAGVIALHDEAAAFDRESAELTAARAAHKARLDWLAGLVAFKAVVLEGVEIVFIVIAVGAGHGLIGPASVGALAAGIVVIIAGVLVRQPLARVPENGLKYVVGLMLSAFGVFWTGEGMGVDWPGADLAIPVFVLLFLLTALGTTWFIRSRRVGA